MLQVRPCQADLTTPRLEAASEPFNRKPHLMYYGVRGGAMFKNLSTSTKLIILCGMFILSISVTTASLVAEHRIAIDFARKELIGDNYLEVLRKYVRCNLERPADQLDHGIGRGVPEQRA